MPQGLAAHTRMKNADWPRLQLKNARCETKLAARIHSQCKKNDRSGVAGLSKIAHKQNQIWDQANGSKRKLRRPRLKIDHQAGVRRSPQWRSIESHGRIRVRQVEFPPTVETDPVGPVFDSEHAAQVTVPTADDKLEQAGQQFHKSCAR